MQAKKITLLAGTGGLRTSYNPLNSHNEVPVCTVEDLIKYLNLKPLPGEGGFFRETYRSSTEIPKDALPDVYSGARSHGTAIYYLLPEGVTSRLHRLSSDEVWHFYLGEPLVLVQISPSGILEEITIGPKITEGQKVQHVVPAGYWFGAFSTGNFSLVGCTVAPGFSFEDFELAKREEMLEQFPQLATHIKKLT